MTLQGFFARLEARVAATGSLLCVGLDPRAGSPTEARDMCRRLVAETAPHAAAFKPNSAFYEAYGAVGFEILADVIASVPEEIPVLLDAKRGDIGPTAEAYAVAAFDRFGAGAVTVSPYLGGDSLEPFLARPDGAVFIVCRTSNPGGADFQESLLATGEPLYMAVARMAASRSPDRVGLVVGATEPGSIAQVRSVAPDHWILAPGVGAQGGSLAASLAAGLRDDGAGVLVPVSRGISQAADPAAAAADLAAATRTHRAAPMAPAPGTDLAQRLLDAGCIRFGDFELRSGAQSPIYLDLRILAGHPILLRRVARSYFPLLGDPDRVAGVPLAGLPLATAVSLETGMPLVYPRAPKSHGTGATVEGAWSPGERVTVVDDVVTSGTSLLEGVARLREAGLQVERAVVLVDREGGGREALAKEGVELRSVLDLRHVVDELARGGRISDEDLLRVRDFLGA